MKAGIITFQSAYNYGAVFQAFALQEFLTENYAKTIIIDYHNEEIDKSYKTPRIMDFFCNTKNSIFKYMQAFLYKGKHRKIDEFRNNYLHLSKYYNIDNITDAINEADVFITGSDQVWNHLIIKGDSTYFLNFALSKKTCSYAASFGISEIPNAYIQFYRNNLKNIMMLSVREYAGAELVQKMVGRNVEVLPDPTLLIDSNRWKKLSIAPRRTGKYILVYKITKADKLLNFARKLAQDTGLPIIYVPNDLKSGVIGSLKTNVGPEEWLGYINCAEYVVTNSFHGTVFSILFGKKFFSEVSTKVNPSTSRLMSLLEMFNLEDRIIENYSYEILKKELDLEMINEKQFHQKEKANIFLRKVFTEE